MAWTAISLFSGCGGMDRGFVDAGFEVLYACDNDPAAVAVYGTNLGSIERQDVTDGGFTARVAGLPRVDVVLGGFPCQGFSKAGPKRQEDRRNHLFWQMHAVVERVQPLVFVAENVEGIVQNFRGYYARLIESVFHDLGYVVEHRVLDAVHYGVPQHRRRTFFVGRRADVTRSFHWPTSSHFSPTRNGEREYEYPQVEGRVRQGLSPPHTIAEAIGNLLEMDAMIPDHEVTWRWPDSVRAIMHRLGEGQKLCNVRFSPSSVHTWDISEVFGQVSQSERLILETIGRNRRHRRYGTIPNGNPLPEEEIIRLTEIQSPLADIRHLESMGYLKRIGDRWDLKGAMFCSGLFKRPVWQSPAPTVLTNFHNPRYFVHPLRDRPFSVRECARLQGFDDAFSFSSASYPVSTIEKYRLVGNAVPPPLARALAFEVIEALKEVRK